jgi:uncharacterized membrane protein (DUF373 family)
METATPREPARERIIEKIERLVVIALRVLIVLFVAAATVTLYVLFATTLPARVTQLSSVSHLLEIMQTVFGGVLGVILGLELAETLKTYFTHHHVRLEVILVVATIAVGRHLIQLDFEHTSASALLAHGVLILCLTFGYLLVKIAAASGK